MHKRHKPVFSYFIDTQYSDLDDLRGLYVSVFDTKAYLADEKASGYLDSWDDDEIDYFKSRGKHYVVTAPEHEAAFFRTLAQAKAYAFSIALEIAEEAADRPVDDVHSNARINAYVKNYLTPARKRIKPIGPVEQTKKQPSAPSRKKTGKRKKVGARKKVAKRRVR